MGEVVDFTEKRLEDLAAIATGKEQEYLLSVLELYLSGDLKVFVTSEKLSITARTPKGRAWVVRNVKRKGPLK